MKEKENINNTNNNCGLLVDAFSSENHKVHNKQTATLISTSQDNHALIGDHQRVPCDTESTSIYYILLERRLKTKPIFEKDDICFEARFFLFLLFFLLIANFSPSIGRSLDSYSCSKGH